MLLRPRRLPLPEPPSPASPDPEPRLAGAPRRPRPGEPPHSGALAAPAPPAPARPRSPARPCPWLRLSARPGVHETELLLGTLLQPAVWRALLLDRRQALKPTYRRRPRWPASRCGAPPRSAAAATSSPRTRSATRMATPGPPTRRSASLWASSATTGAGVTPPPCLDDPRAAAGLLSAAPAEPGRWVSVRRAPDGGERGERSGGAPPMRSGWGATAAPCTEGGAPPATAAPFQALPPLPASRELDSDPAWTLRFSPSSPKLRTRHTPRLPDGPLHLHTRAWAARRA